MAYNPRFFVQPPNPYEEHPAQNPYEEHPAPEQYEEQLAPEHAYDNQPPNYAEVYRPPQYARPFIRPPSYAEPYGQPFMQPPLPQPRTFSISLTFDIDPTHLQTAYECQKFDKFLQDVTASIRPSVELRVRSYFDKPQDKGTHLKQLELLVKQFYEENYTPEMSKQEFAKMTFDHFKTSHISEGVINIMLAQAAGMPLNTFRQQLLHRWTDAWEESPQGFDREEFIMDNVRRGFARVFSGTIEKLPRFKVEKMLKDIEYEYSR